MASLARCTRSASSSRSAAEWNRSTVLGTRSLGRTEPQPLRPLSPLTPPTRRMKISSWLSVLLVAATSGCVARTTIDKLDELEPGHAVVFGKLVVRYNHSTITDKANFWLRDQAR